MTGLRPGDEPLDLVCELDAIPAEGAAEHRRAFAAWQAALLSTTETDAGFVFQLPAESWPDVVSFVQFERRCCSFLTFALTLAPAGSLSFEISGPPGAKEVLRAAAAGLRA